MFFFLAQGAHELTISFRQTKPFIWLYHYKAIFLDIICALAKAVGVNVTLTFAYTQAIHLKSTL